MIDTLLAVLFLILTGWFAWESTLEVDRQKKTRRLKKNNVNKHTRAGSQGKLIQCPFCAEETRVFHFSWVAIVCESCDETVRKFDWRI